MNNECPYYSPARIAVDPNTDSVYEGAVMCDLDDKPCSMEYGDDCEVYTEYLSELGEEHGN
ncbi:MAG: hypothetical protein ACXABY_05205 [Candidatus Thorarchaeota archaeon]|jgi:hypothetical protein